MSKIKTMTVTAIARNTRPTQSLVLFQLAVLILHFKGFQIVLNLDQLTHGPCLHFQECPYTICTWPWHHRLPIVVHIEDGRHDYLINWNRAFL